MENNKQKDTGHNTVYIADIKSTFIYRQCILQNISYVHVCACEDVLEKSIVTTTIVNLNWKKWICWLLTNENMKIQIQKRGREKLQKNKKTNTEWVGA